MRPALVITLALLLALAFGGEEPAPAAAQSLCQGSRARLSAADALEDGVRLGGPVGGVKVSFVGRRTLHEAMDCRLVRALERWAPALRRAGVGELRHLSAFRRGARIRSNGRPSGHARGLAIDVRYFVFDDGTELDVLEDWAVRTRGAPPCEMPEDEPEESALIRRLVCDALEERIFQVMVTPHHNDAHANHVHLEVVPGVAWQWAR